jgi:hypothetical protein
MKTTSSSVRIVALLAVLCLTTSAAQAGVWEQPPPTGTPVPPPSPSLKVTGEHSMPWWLVDLAALYAQMLGGA